MGLAKQRMSHVKNLLKHISIQETAPPARPTVLPMPAKKNNRLIVISRQ
jgi:hypothetical protein